MTLTENLKKNEEYSVLNDISIGDLVELFVDGKFFGRPDKKYERYGGYIASIGNSKIGLSPTHPSNRSHGYTHREKDEERRDEEQKVVKIATNLIKEYRVL